MPLKHLQEGWERKTSVVRGKKKESRERQGIQSREWQPKQLRHQELNEQEWADWKDWQHRGLAFHDRRYLQQTWLLKDKKTCLPIFCLASFSFTSITLKVPRIELLSPIFSSLHASVNPCTILFGPFFNVIRIIFFSAFLFVQCLTSLPAFLYLSSSCICFCKHTHRKRATFFSVFYQTSLLLSSFLKIFSSILLFFSPYS